MKKIAVSMRNRVFAESIMFMLESTGDFRPVRISTEPEERVLLEFRAAAPEIVLLDVTPTSEGTSLTGSLTFRINRKFLPAFPEFIHI